MDLVETAEWVKEARRTLGLTQQGLADALEMDARYAKDTVRSWEDARRPMSGPARVALRLMLAAHAAKAGRKRGKAVAHG